LETRTCPQVGCSIASATTAASISGATRFLRIGFLRLISCSASSPPLSCVATFNYIISADRSQFKCANGIHSLLGNTPVNWPSGNCQTYLDALRNLEQLGQRVIK
jgi:hypothetical protein